MDILSHLIKDCRKQTKNLEKDCNQINNIVEELKYYFYQNKIKNKINKKWQK